MIWKYRVIVGVLMCLSVSAEAMIDTVTGTCGSGDGKLLTGNDGTTQYCQSKIKMNWWSAHAWCHSIGGELIDIVVECDKGKDENATVSCPQLKALGGSGAYVWSQQVSGTDSVYCPNLYSGAIHSQNRSNHLIFALCINFTQ